MSEETKELAKIATGKKVLKPGDVNKIFDPEGLKEMLVVCQHFILSKAVPSCYSQASQVLMAIQAGRELGMKPVESLNGLYIVNGQFKLWGSALTGRTTVLGYKIKWHEATALKARVSVINPDKEETSIEEYTIEEAKAAGLLGKMPWKAHPKVMLRHRALGNCIKFNFPHLLQGFSLVEDDDTVEHSFDNVPRGGQKIEASDNASKLLKKDGGEEKAVEGEIVKAEEPAEEKSPKIGENGVRIIQEMIVVACSEEEAILKYYKVEKLSDLTETQAKDLSIKLEEKAKQNAEKRKEENKVKNTKSLIPPAKEGESEAAKKIRKSAEEQKKKSDEPKIVLISEDVCQYLNKIKDVDEMTLPNDILVLKMDSNRGTFKGVDAYPSLQAELDKLDKIEEPSPVATTALEAQAIDTLPIVQLTPDILEVSNDLAAHNLSDLNDDQKRFLMDANNNQFKGKDNYKGVKF